MPLRLAVIALAVLAWVAYRVTRNKGGSYDPVSG